MQKIEKVVGVFPLWYKWLTDWKMMTIFHSIYKYDPKLQKLETDYDRTWYSILIHSPKLDVHNSWFELADFSESKETKKMFICFNGKQDKVYVRLWEKNYWK